MSTPTWRAALAAQIPEHLGKEIDDYALEMELRRNDRMDERLFAESRLRRGVYGQRYDNGQRHDGIRTRRLDYPSGDLLKGPNTLWNAPGMQRIKIPFGALNAPQMEVLAELAEDYSDAVMHVTTRQDIQFHFVRIDDTPDLMRRLAAVGITTREACGNSVRNVTACPLAGVCHDETFDVTPHAHALASFLLGHPDAQDFGRKFKVAFSGCRESACGVVAFHDLGLIARVDHSGGMEARGFELWVGGGLGPVPHQAKLFAPFVHERELLPIAQAMCRVFAQRGEKHNRARARLKFLIAGLGIDEFRRLVTEERAGLRDDPRWTAHLTEATSTTPGNGSADSDPRPPNGAGDTESALEPPAHDAPDADFERWVQTNVHPQRQAGYVAATVALPLGDISSAQMRSLASLVPTPGSDSVRTTVEQNIVFRWLPEAHLPHFYAELLRIDLAQPGAGTIVDVVSCPGTDTCKLGIASSRGLAGHLRNRLSERNALADEAIQGLHIKVSGCFNSCGQHHVADLGFYGVSRKVEGRTVPHFQVVLGGQWEENAGAFGLAIGAVPSKRIPEVVDRLTDWYRAERRGPERFREFVQRVGKAEIRSRLEDLMQVPAHESEPELYSDWGDPREFSIGDIGAGECAGEVVSRFDFDLAASERQVFEAQLRLDAGNGEEATRLAYAAMLQAAHAMLGSIGVDTGGGSPAADAATHADATVAAFRTHLYDTKRFFDPFAGAKFANYLFALHEQDIDSVRADTAQADSPRPDAARAHVEEAQLFIEACHACHARPFEAEARVSGGAVA